MEERLKTFLNNSKQKRNIKKEPERFPVLPKTLAEYRAGRKGYIDAYAAVSILMPLAMQIAVVHEEGQTLPSLRPDTIDILNRRFVLNEAAYKYEGVIFPGYSAPEIYEGKTYGIVTDIYAFCAVLYYLIVGKAPENAFNRLSNSHLPIVSEEIYEDIKRAESIYLPELKAEDDPFESEIVKWEHADNSIDEIIDDNFIGILEKGLSLVSEDRFISMENIIASLQPYNTKAAYIYPLLLDIDAEMIHNDLIITKQVVAKKQSPVLFSRFLPLGIRRIGAEEVEVKEGSNQIDLLPIKPDESAPKDISVDMVNSEEITSDEMYGEVQIETAAEDEPSTGMIEESSEELVEEIVETTDYLVDEQISESSSEESSVSSIEDVEDILSLDSEHIVSFGEEKDSDEVTQEDIIGSSEEVEVPTPSNELTKSLQEMWEMLESLQEETKIH